VCPTPTNTAQIVTSKAKIVQLFIVIADSLWLTSLFSRAFMH
jgi:hypothetical protein